MTSSMFFSALRLATKAHDGQWRKGEDAEAAPPYVTHCIEVAEVISVQGDIQVPSVQAVALLHDTVEDTYVTHELLCEEFGKYVADCVQHLTLPNDIQRGSDYSQMKHLWQMKSLENMDRFTKLVKYADKTCNIRDLARYKPTWKVASIKSYAEKARELCSAVDASTEVPEGMRKLHDEITAVFDNTYG